MEKINFINNSVPALNSTNLNKLQDNVEDAMKSERTSSNTDTYSCNYINECKTYSTNETLTGETWIDGKPIYRKVIEYTGEIQASTWTSISISSLGIYYVDNLVVKGGYLKYPENITESIYSYSNRVQFLNYNNNISFYFAVSPSKVTLIVEYTKTTD